MNSSQLIYEQYLDRIPGKPLEHLLYPNLFVNDPAYVVRIDHEDQVMAHFGGWIVDKDTTAGGILFRATMLLECSMVSPALNVARAFLFCRFGAVEFHYNEEAWCYEAVEDTAIKT